MSIIDMENPQQILVPTLGWTHSISRRRENIIREAFWIVRRVALVSLRPKDDCTFSYKELRRDPNGMIYLYAYSKD